MATSLFYDALVPFAERWIMKRRIVSLIVMFSVACFVCCLSESQSMAATTCTASKSKKTRQKTIFIAAGHQKRQISQLEPLAPGSTQKKAKLTSGAAGVKTKIPEYVTNLAIAKETQKELKKRGYKVIMLRTTNNCPLSNKERTKKANQSGADIHICIHCNSSKSSKEKGPLVCVPKSARYVGKSVYRNSLNLANKVIDEVAKAENKKKVANIYSNYYTTINYATIPTFILECGFLSNPIEDKQLNSASYQKKIAKGIANGVDAYFRTVK